MKCNCNDKDCQSSASVYPGQENVGMMVTNVNGIHGYIIHFNPQNALLLAAEITKAANAILDKVS